MRGPESQTIESSGGMFLSALIRSIQLALNVLEFSFMGWTDSKYRDRVPNRRIREQVGGQTSFRWNYAGWMAWKGNFYRSGFDAEILPPQELEK